MFIKRAITSGHSLIVVLGLFGLPVAANAETTLVPTRADAASYMVYYDRIRNFRTLQYTAEGLSEQMAAQATFDEANYQRNAQLYPQAAISELDLMISDAVRQISAISVGKFRHEANANGAVAAANATLLPYVQGLPVSLDTAYGHYKRAWDESCAARSDGIKEAKAKVKLAAYRLKQAHDLLPSGAVTLEEYELRVAEHLQAISEEKTRTKLFNICHDNEPSLDFLAGLVTN